MWPQLGLLVFAWLKYYKLDDSIQEFDTGASDHIDVFVFVI